jgi:hypothetical protein
MDASDPNLTDLFSELCDATITEAAFATLETRLRADADSRRQYIRYMQLHAELAWTDGALSAVGEQAMLDDAVGLASAARSLKSKSHPTPPLAITHPSVLRRVGLAVAAAMVIAVPAVFYFIDWRGVWDQPLVAVLEAGDSATFSPDFKPADDLHPGRIIRLERGTAHLDFRTGSRVTLDGATALRIESQDRATLLSGAMTAAVPREAIGFIVDAPNLRVIDLGTRFAVLAQPRSDTEVHVFEGRVEVQPRVRLPRVFFSFDESTPESIDPIGGHKGFPLGGASRVKGLVGSGAVSLDNSKDACVLLGDGGSKEPGEGVFGVSQGVTIEMIIVPRWSGLGWSTRTPKPFDYDELFRKEDGDRRMLLCFQNDTGAEQKLIPVVDPGPCLSFGLNLEDTGYSEMDMPLDGQEGRPTLAQLKDGKPHHVVATYDAATGIKAIYIDGTLRFRHRFRPGSRIAAGGPMPATIGTNYGLPDESFNGVIDEFAFYGVALSPGEVAGHWRNVQAGRNYYGGARVYRAADGSPAAVIPLKAGQAMRFDLDTGLLVEAMLVAEPSSGK